METEAYFAVLMVSKSLNLLSRSSDRLSPEVEEAPMLLPLCPLARLTLILARVTIAI